MRFWYWQKKKSIWDKEVQ